MPIRKISLDPSGDPGNTHDSDESEDEPAIIPLIVNPPDANSSKNVDQFQTLKVALDRVPDKRRQSSIRPFNGAYVQLHVLSGIEEAKYWKRLARWVKYEEQEVEGAERLGNPRIPTLSFQSLTSLRRLLRQGVILLDLDEADLPGIWLRVSEHLRKKHGKSDEVLEPDDTTPELFLLEHRRGYDEARRSSVSAFRNGVKGSSEGNLQNVYVDSVVGAKEKRDSLRRNSAIPRLQAPPVEFRKYSTSLSAVIGEDGGRRGSGWAVNSSAKTRDTLALNKILLGTEATVVLVGREESLRVPTIAFVRLAHAVCLPDVTEVDVPVRFVVILLGPNFNSELEYKEVGRSMATLMSNPSFHNLALNARVPDAILRGINGFLAESIVLPPGDWDPALFPFEELKEAKKVIQQRRKSTVSLGRGNVFTILEEEGSQSQFSESGSSLKRTKRPFGGLTLDIRRRYSKYWSDLKDGLNLQCVATILFVYFGHVTGNIAFGGLMGQKTDNYIGIAETLVGAGIAGVIFALLSAQPLLLIGTTPPLIMFDESLYKLCIRYGMPPTEFLAVRTWIGLWMAVIALAMVCFEGSCLIKFFTRFTQEIFLTLISLVFIVESLSNLYRVFDRHPLTSTYGTCDTDGSILIPGIDESRPNVALLTCILMLGTYLIAISVKEFRNSDYFTAGMRDAIGNFAVLIAIAAMSSIDFYFKDTETRKLSLPDASEGLKTTLDNRTWIIYPFDESNGEFQHPFGYWIILLTALPALLVFILIFMESSISELMVTRKEMKLRKWDGLHLNLLLICIVNTGMGYIGSAWVAAPTIRSVTHASSLAIFSINNAPGEKPKILGVHEQRITSLAISIMVGVSVFMSDLLKLVPMAVLFGVFLYMGVTSLNGVQMVERIGLLFKPLERYPEVPYVQRVRRWKMHLYTVLQIGCLAALWAIKESPAALALALLIILLVPLRFCILSHWFNSVELNALDGPAPKGVNEDEAEFDDESIID